MYEQNKKLFLKSCCLSVSSKLRWRLTKDKTNISFFSLKAFLFPDKVRFWFISLPLWHQPEMNRDHGFERNLNFLTSWHYISVFYAFKKGYLHQKIYSNYRQIIILHCNKRLGTPTDFLGHHGTITNIARGTTDPGIASITWIISPDTKQANSVERKIQHSIRPNFDHQVASTNSISSKFTDQMASLALVTNLH